jgi:hypothetical protein
MTNRIQKRHKRQVSRAKERVKLSEPDVRTPEQITAAREASRPAGGWNSGRQAQYSKVSTRNQPAAAAGSAAKADA